MSDYFAMYLVSSKLKKTFCKYCKIRKSGSLCYFLFLSIGSVRIHDFDYFDLFLKICYKKKEMI